MLDLSVTVKRPQGTKIQPRKNSYYVYHVLSSTYNKEQKYVTEKRKCIGKLVSKDSTDMYPNEYFDIYYPHANKSILKIEALPEPPLFHDTLKVGAMIAIRKLATSSGILKILKELYDQSIAYELIDLISYIIISSSISLEHYPFFLKEHLRLGTKIETLDVIKNQLTDQKINELLNQLAQLKIMHKIEHSDFKSLYETCNESSMQHLIFIASSIYSYLKLIGQKIKNEFEDLSITKMLDELECIQCTRNSIGIFKRRYALTALQKAIFQELRITENELDDQINQFNLRQANQAS